MRFLIVAVLLASALAFSSCTDAQTAPQSSAPAAPSGGTGSGLETERKAHPNWFTEPNTYKPCPGSVVFPHVAPLASAAPNHAGGASVSIKATPTNRDRAARGSQTTQGNWRGRGSAVRCPPHFSIT